MRLTGERVDRRMRRTLLIRSGRCKDRSRDRKCGGRHFPQAGRRFPKFNRLSAHDCLFTAAGCRSDPCSTPCGWFNFTAVGGACCTLARGVRGGRCWLAGGADGYRLLPDGLRVPYRLPMGRLSATWAWYGMAMVLDRFCCTPRRRGAGWAASLLGPTSFFVVSNYAVWAWVPCIRTRRADWARATWQGCCFTGMT